jgi:hypothetical protein
MTRTKRISKLILTAREGNLVASFAFTSRGQQYRQEVILDEVDLGIDARNSARRIFVVSAPKLAQVA